MSWRARNDRRGARLLNKQHNLTTLQRPGEFGFTQEADAGGDSPTPGMFYYRRTSHPSPCPSAGRSYCYSRPRDGDVEGVAVREGFLPDRMTRHFLVRNVEWRHTNICFRLINELCVIQRSLRTHYTEIKESPLPYCNVIGCLIHLADRSVSCLKCS